jgi:putative ABC transport system permease protein
VAAGVATIVALRSLGLAIGDSLTGNVRATLHGDLRLETYGSGGFLELGNPEEEVGFAAWQLDSLDGWVRELGGQYAVVTTTGNIQVAALDFETAGRLQFTSSYFIDPATYPPTQDILALDPAGVPLGDLFQGGNEVVVSENLAEQQGIAVGDQVRVSGTEDEFVVRGIVATSTEAGLRNLGEAFFGFVYFDQALQENLPVPADPNRVHIALPDGTSLEMIEQRGNDVRQVVNSGGYEVDTVGEVLEENRNIADVLDSFIVVLGLGALLIGGVGIMNTMLVLMRRRTDEIAAMKTFGLKGGQIAALFLAEAFILGVVGSLLGGVFGVLLSGLANAYGQTLIQQPLRFAVYPEAIGFGLVVGLVITLVFGIIPVLVAVKIRPAIILRPNENAVPRLGCLQAIFMLLLVVFVIGVIAGQILQPTFALANAWVLTPFITGIVGVAVTLLILGVLIGILWVIVWIVSKLPTFGWVDLRLALRNMTTHRTRTATTLLALSAGMFALSSIAIFGAGISQIIRFTLAETLGGNVLVFSLIPGEIGQTAVRATLNTTEGVEYWTRYQSFFGELRTVDGEIINSNPGSFDFSDPESFDGPPGPGGGGFQFSNSFLSVSVAETTNPTPRVETFLSGRGLTAEDDGERVAVLRMRPEFASLGIEVGSTIEVNIDGDDVELEVVGLLPEATSTSALSGGGLPGVSTGDLRVPGGVLGTSFFSLNVAQIRADRLDQALVDLSAVPLLYSFDITFIDGLIGRFISQLSAIPILVGILSLGAAAVIMANTVALATLERRRQIGILKAVGLKGGRVLRVMLLENTIVGLLGGLLGIGFSALTIGILSATGSALTSIIPADAVPVVVILLVVAILIAWLATILSARTALGERVTSVLRYE